MKADQLSKPNTLNENSESCSASEEGTLQSQTTPNATVRRKEASSSSMSEGAGICQKPLVDKVENELPHPNLQVGPIPPQEASAFFGSSETVSADLRSAYSRLGNDLAEKLQKQSPVDKIHSDVKEKSEWKEILLTKKSHTPRVQHADISTRLQESSQEVEFPKSVEAENIKSISPEVSDKIGKLGLTQKAPSNIRKMISAFESSLAQERGPATKPLAVKSQSNRVGMVHLLKDQVLKGASEMSESSSGRLENPTVSGLGKLKNSFSTEDLQRTPANILKKGEQTSFQKDFGGFKSSLAVRQLTESSATKPQPKGMDASVLKVELGSAHRDIITRKIEKSLEDIKRPSAMEEATFSGRKDRERDSAGKNMVIRGELKSAYGETIEKEMMKFKLPSSVEEATGLGRVQKERDPAGMLIVKNEFRSSNKEINTNELARLDSIMKNDVGLANKETNTEELATSDSMRPSTLEAATISGRIQEVGERDFGGTSGVTQEFKSAQKETNTNGMAESPGNFTRSSTLEAGTLLGTTDEQQDPSGKPVVEGRGKRISLTKNSPEINTREASKDNLDYFPNESSGAWIFPDDRRHLCITAEGDKIMKSLGGRIVEENHHKKKIPMVPENIGKDMIQCGTDAEVKNSEEKFNSSRNSCPESSADDASTGPLGQVIKIAVVVGFGLLVLLTRQRQPRKAKRKETDYLMDQQGSIEEQLKKINIF